MNRVVLIGRLTKDPELRFTPGKGTAVCTFNLAVDRRIKKENGSKDADFIPVVVWGKQAENTVNYVGKGRLIGISGRIQTRNYEAKDGTKRYVTEVVADEVQFLDYAKTSSVSSQNEESQNFEDQNNLYGEEITPVDGDIPF